MVTSCNLFATILLASAAFLFLISCSKYNEELAFVSPELSLRLSREDQTGRAKLVFKVRQGWHIYGPNPQKNGRPTTAQFFFDDKEVPAMVWPATKSFDEGQSGASDGFDGQFEIVLPERADTVTKIIAKVSWVACKDICVPGEATLINDI